jgi:putative membrane protein
MYQQNRKLLIGLGVVASLFIVGPMLLGGVFGPGMMGWRYGNGTAPGNGWLWGLGMGLGGLMMVAFWGVIIVGIVLLVRSIAGQSAGGTGATPAEDALTILRRRYAAGEIDEQTYQRMKAQLTNAESPTREPVVANGRTRNSP